MLAPSLRLGYLVAPKAVFPKLLQAKQAADLHSPGFNQRVVAEVMKDGFLDRHVPTHPRALQVATRRDAGRAGAAHAARTCSWNRPDGGMFLWARLPEGLDAAALLPKAVDTRRGLRAGRGLLRRPADARTLRLSFVTASAEEIERGVTALAAVIREQMP